MYTTQNSVNLRAFALTLFEYNQPTSTSRSTSLKTLDGHFCAQVPQESHFERSTTGMNVSRLMHCLGQLRTQRPHLKHAILQVLATACFTGFLLEHRTIAPFCSLATDLNSPCGHSVMQRPQPVHFA